MQHFIQHPVDLYLLVGLVTSLYWFLTGLVEDLVIPPTSEFSANLYDTVERRFVFDKFFIGFTIVLLIPFVNIPALYLWWRGSKYQG